MSESKRALRRHHRKRLKNKRQNQTSFQNLELEEKYSSKMLPKSIDTPKPCSCFMCGNPRKFYNELSIQEKKSKEYFAQLDFTF